MKKLFTSLVLVLALLSSAFGQSISAFGDSQTNATYYTNSAVIWRNILAANLGQTVTSYAQDGAQVGDQLPLVVARSRPGANDKSIIWLGVNHQKQGVNATKQLYFKEGLRSLILQRALATIVVAAASTSGETGSWEGTGLWPSFGRASLSTGNVKPMTVAGTTIYPSVLLVEGGGGTGTYDIRIDGGSWQSFDANSPGITSPNGYSYSERAHRITGLSSGNHVVEWRHTGGTKLYVEWVGGNAQTVKPKVYVGNIPRASSAAGMGYAAFGGSTANVQSYNADIAAVVAELVADGLDVTLVDLYSVLNDTTDLTTSANCTSPCQPDGFHISDAGHAKVAAAFYTAMTGGAPPPTVTYNPLYKGSDGLYYKDVAGTKVLTSVP